MPVRPDSGSIVNKVSKQKKGFLLKKALCWMGIVIYRSMISFLFTFWLPPWFLIK